MSVEFANWMSIHTQLSVSSVGKYAGAVLTISKEMHSVGFIVKPLSDMSLIELDVAISVILAHPGFIRKNKKGNHMYSNSLKQYRYFRLDTSDEYEISLDPGLVLKDDDAHYLTQTEKETIMKARIGQGPYRKRLLEKYEKRCVVTGIDNAKLLVASHIKPWSVCDNQERIDGENGLLLSANMDKLFDCGLITFSHAGKLFVSSFVGKENEKRLHITDSIIVKLRATPRLLEYLDYHQDVLFVK